MRCVTELLKWYEWGVVGFVKSGVRGVTDSGLEALASKGCGAQLASLTLWGV